MDGNDVIAIDAGVANIWVTMDIVTYLLSKDGGCRQTPKYHSADVL
jgi:hypothetical protein